MYNVVSVRSSGYIQSFITTFRITFEIRRSFQIAQIRLQKLLYTAGNKWIQNLDSQLRVVAIHVAQILTDPDCTAYPENRIHGERLILRFRENFKMVQIYLQISVSLRLITEACPYISDKSPKISVLNKVAQV